MPGIVPITSTKALTNATLPYIARIARQGMTDALSTDEGLARGVNVASGAVTHPAVAEAHALSYVSVADAVLS
jgi:alanine dehydrogenase